MDKLYTISFFFLKFKRAWFQNSVVKFIFVGDEQRIARNFLIGGRSALQQIFTSTVYNESSQPLSLPRNPLQGPVNVRIDVPEMAGTKQTI